MGILIPLFVCYIIYLVLRTPTDSGTDASRFVAGNSDNDYLRMNFLGDEDWITDPAYSYMPGNIFYHDSSQHFDCSCSGSDWMTDPCCSYMSGNIYHHDDTSFSGSSSSMFNDDWHTTSSTCSSFDDSCSSSYRSSFNDD